MCVCMCVCVHVYGVCGCVGGGGGGVEHEIIHTPEIEHYTLHYMYMYI